MEYRTLTPYGKVVIITSLLISKITHILLSPSTTLSQLEELFYDFLWNDKPPKFRNEIVEANTNDGGLKLHNLKKFDVYCMFINCNIAITKSYYHTRNVYIIKCTQQEYTRLCHTRWALYVQMPYISWMLP